MREPPYPPGTRVKHRSTPEELPDTFGRVVERGPSVYGTSELPEGCMFVALEKTTRNTHGGVLPAGAILVGSPQSWEKVGERVD